MSPLARLRELIAALDRRAPHPERPAEARIAAESAALRERALSQAAHLERER